MVGVEAKAEWLEPSAPPPLIEEEEEELEDELDFEMF